MKNNGKKKIFFTRMIIIAIWLFLVNLVPHLGAEDGLSDQEIIKRFHQIYYGNTLLWSEKTTWLGVVCEQTPHDNWMMQEIIYEIKPDFIIETGTYKGGSALFYATVLDHVNKDGKVITVDIENQLDSNASKQEIFMKRVEFILGDSVSQKVINTIDKKVKNHTVLVTLDSLHTKEHVLKELKLYSNFVSVGSYIIVQDTNINGHPVLPAFGPGPMEAVEEFLKTDDRFIIDHSREKFLITFYPSGYLKRVK